MQTGEIIRQLRKDNKLTLEQLSSKIKDITGKKVSTGNISDWEKGRSKPSSAYAMALSEIFHVNPNFLITGEEDQAAAPTEITERVQELSDIKSGCGIKKSLIEYLSSISDLNLQNIDMTEDISSKITDRILYIINNDLNSFLYGQLTDLTKDEINIVMLYRQLSEKQQGKVEGYTQALVADSESSHKGNSYHYTPGSEDAAAEEGAEYKFEKHA